MIATDEHWRLFGEFCRYEKMTGGPDPQIAMIHALSEGHSVDEKVWRAGCYGAVYNTGGAIVLWDALTRDDVLAMSEKELTAFLARLWPDIPFRRERRAVRSAGKLAKHLRSYAIVSRDWPDRDWWRAPSTPATYEAAWADVLSVWGVGRYIAIKLLELFHRHGAGTAAYDIRAKDAWSPRIALGLLWPDNASSLNGDKTKRGAVHAERIATDTIARLSDDQGVVVSPFELQVLTCEYRESIESRRQYPGRSHDSEDKYLIAIEPSLAQAGYDSRAALFPRECLGELAGWRGNRDELGHVAADHRYTWSDLVYDYRLTTNLADPVRR